MANIHCFKCALFPSLLPYSFSLLLLSWVLHESFCFKLEETQKRHLDMELSHNSTQTQNYVTLDRLLSFLCIFFSNYKMLMLKLMFLHLLAKSKRLSVWERWGEKVGYYTVQWSSVDCLHLNEKNALNVNSSNQSQVSKIVLVLLSAEKYH